MAYAAVVNVKKTMWAGLLAWEITIAETDASPGDETVVTGGFPPDVTFANLDSYLSAGAGTTLNPMFGKELAFVADDGEHLATNSTTAQKINDNTRWQASGLVGGKFVWRPNVDAGSDNVITTRIVLIKGHVT